MERTITVKGTGQASARPDEIHIFLTLNAQNAAYQETMALADRQHDALTRALAPQDIAAADIKTASFNVDTVYESVQKSDGSFHNRFVGYRCTHQLRIELPLDLKRLGVILTAVTDSAAEPEISLRFTVRDAEALKDDALRIAAADARRKAELLTAAGGVRLGELVHIAYDRGDHNAYAPLAVQSMRAKTIDMAFEPQDVQVSETAAFTWTID